MRQCASLALPGDIKEGSLDFFSSQFKEGNDHLWWRAGEFTTLEEAIKEGLRMKECYASRDVKTRIVKVRYEIIPV